ncbi:MAG: glycoside hydrolase family 5 protein [Leptolyngbyaceae cyanobacterium SM1_4_3]|nr:glycoside hydrolase family 5 protein [Leptolyngbyaceae cyanobacterium SM1_4_3]
MQSSKGFGQKNQQPLGTASPDITTSPLSIPKYSPSVHKQRSSGSLTAATSQTLSQRSAPATTTPAARSDSSNDFRVVGTKIYDPNGREFIAKGVNINGPGYGWPGKTPEQVDNIKRWGFNSIRLNVRQLGLDNKQTYAENGTIDAIVEKFTSQRIVVMIEPHERTGKWFSSDELNKLVNWHKGLASKYKDNPYVWLNVSNEPGGSDSGSSSAVSKYVQQNTSVIKAIRSTGFDNPIVVDGWSWGQDTGSWNSNPVSESKSAILSLGQKLLAADPNKNTVFSLHTYDQWKTNTQAKMNDFINRVHAKGLALIVGEYGAENGSSGRFKETVSGVLPVVQKREVGRFAWAWQGGDAFDLTTNGGGYKANFSSNGSMPDNLSWFGQQVWKDAHRAENLQMHPGKPPEPVPLPTPEPISSPTPSPVPKPSPSGSLRYEAENMSRSGYSTEDLSSASGRKLVKLSGAKGSLSQTFRGEFGTYDVVVGYFDENDGRSILKLDFAAKDFTLRFDQNLPSDKASSSSFARRTLGSVQLKEGEMFKLEGVRDRGEYARIDYLEFVRKPA